MTDEPQVVEEQPRERSLQEFTYEELLEKINNLRARRAVARDRRRIAKAGSEVSPAEKAKRPRKGRAVLEDASNDDLLLSMMGETAEEKEDEQEPEIELP